MKKNILYGPWMFSKKQSRGKIKKGNNKLASGVSVQQMDHVGPVFKLMMGWAPGTMCLVKVTRKMRPLRNRIHMSPCRLLQKALLPPKKRPQTPMIRPRPIVTKVRNKQGGRTHNWVRESATQKRLLGGWFDPTSHQQIKWA